MRGEPPFRTQAYRVEHRLRDLTPEEDALARAELEKSRAVRALVEQPHPLAELGCVVFLGVAGYGVWQGSLAIMASMVGATLFLLFLELTRAKKRIASWASPWQPPEGGWKMRETRIAARSLVVAVSVYPDLVIAGERMHDDDDTYWTNWMLFEIPGGEWFFLELRPRTEVPDGEQVDLAREHVDLNRFWPHGPRASFRTSGATIPRHGAVGTESSFSDDVERGWLWTPSQVPDDAPLGSWDDVVAESALPTWIREIVKRD